MPYISKINLYKTNRAAALTELWAQLVIMGWTLHDNMDASSYRVYKSDGELANRINEYIKIDWLTANQIKFRAHFFWNAATHAGVGLSYTDGYITTSESGFYLWFYGNKDLVILCTKISTTYCHSGFGHLPKRWWTTCLATTSNAEVAGSNVVVEVNNTTNFKVGKYYQIVGANGEGRDRIQVTAIVAGVSLTIASLPRNYGAGSLIGNCPSTFGNFTAHVATFCHTCPYNVVGTTNSSANLSQSLLIPISQIDPDGRQEDAYILQPKLYTGDYDILGYTDEFLIHCPTTGLLVEDVFGVNELDSGTSSGSNTLSTLNDISKNWPVNGYTNKVLLIKAGTGSGQIRKVISNTTTELTISENWVTLPDATSTYSICDEGFRLMDTTSCTGMREGV